ncbi:MAG: choice-of-anchor D domain-containing protein [Xanthomarina gelatinilytica]|uniref:choice-of-anchor D domain-containing protein n=1 Tax=Xanthomarina gelatinilytica TaxID=1137281 RepID=UPI003A85B16A
MIKKYSLVLAVFLCFVLSGFGQTVIFNEAGGGAFPAGWTGTNNVTTNDIDRGSYYLVDAGNPSDIITTAIYDLSAYATAEFSLDVASFGSSTYNAARIEVSFNGGTTFSQTEISTTTTGSSYINGGTFTLNSLTNQVQIRISNNGTSGRGVRLRNLILEATAPAGPTITATPTTLTGLDYVETLGPSAEQSFDVEGTLLTDNIILTAPTNFEISTTSGSGFGTTITLTESGGTVNATTIYTRLIAGLTANTYTGNITATSTGASDVDIDLEGSVTSASGPCASESFISIPSNSSGSYLTRYWTGDDGIDWTATDARTDQTLNGNNAITLRTGSLTNDTSFTGGCGIITFDYARIFNDNSTLQVWINGTQYGGDITVTATGSTTFSTTVNVGGNIDVELRNSGNRTLINNLSWTCYTGTPNPELQLVDDTTTNQNCGYTIDFGAQVLSTNTDLTFDIENVGSADLDISSFGITGDYTILSPPTPLTITSGNSQTVTVRFTPSATGTRNGVLTINNNDIDEGACVVNLTGEGFVPAPNIRVERSTEALIPNGSTPNIGFNTIFATTDLGDTSVPRLYYIRNGNSTNPATADLTVNTIVSSNNAEFTVTSLPALPITLAPDEFISFEIEFSPNSTTPATRTSTITVTSNDSTDNPYTFGVSGTAGCPLYSGAILPTSGPVGTEITITSAEDLTSASATLNGEPLTVVSSSVGELIVQVPHTITLGGALTVLLSNGCSFTNTFVLIDNAIQSCEGTGSTPSELFISQVTDSGTDSVSYIEVYNGTGSTITDLSNYSIHIYNNGRSTPLNSNYIIDLNNVNLLNGSTYTLALGTNINGLNCIPEHDLSNLADQQDTNSGVSINFVKDDNFNIGHDHIRLYNNSTHIDSWGVYEDESWAISLNLQGKGANFMRRTDATLPDINFNTADWIIQDWGNSCSDLDYSDIGVYDFSVGVPPTSSLLVGPTSDCLLTATLTVTGAEGYSGGNPLAHQWYYSAPGDTDWTPVPNAAPYSGYNAATLDISNTLNLDGYQYYCQIREDDALCFKASNAVKLHVTKTVWDGTDWTNSTPPDEFTVAVIDGTYDTGLHGDIDACQLIINSGVNRTLNITNSHYVRVVNNVVNNGVITVQTHGAFVQEGVGANAGTFTNNGSASVIKYTDILNDWYEYTYWSSPVVNQLINAATPDTPNSRRFYFETANYLDEHTVGTTNNVPDDIDDDGNDWQNASGDIMELGRGYATTSSPLGSFPGVDQAIFEGTFFTGDLLKPIITNGFSGDNDWNLVGNPYASAIAFNDLHTENSAIIDGAAYLWSQALPPLITNPGNEVLNFNQADYAIITTGSGNIAGGSTVIPTSFIPSGQGFFVKALNSGGDLRFTNAMRRADNTSNNQFFRLDNSNQNTSNNQTNRLWVNLTSDNGVFNQILIAYVDGATNGYDGWSYDAPRNLSSGLASVIYTSIEEVDNIRYAIQGKHSNSLNLDEVIPLGFYTSINEATLYSLSIEQFEGEFFSNNNVFVKDNLLNIIHNLNNAPYTFTSGVGEFNERFEIVFRDSFLSVNEEEISANNLTIIELQNGEVRFTVPPQHKIQSVEIIDLLGKTVYNLKGNSSTETYNLSNLSQATYVARVTLANGQVLTKKAVKRK